MGSSLSTQPEAPVSASGRAPVEDNVVNDKRHYWEVPETEYDDLPVYDNAPAGGVLRVSSKELEALAADTSDSYLRLCAILRTMQKQRFFVVTADDEEREALSTLHECSREFFSQEKAIKEYQAPAPSGEHGNRNGLRWYSELYFDNRENRRDPERRDVLQIRLNEGDPNSWPSEKLRENATRVFHRQFELSVAVMRVLALALDLPRDTFVATACAGMSEGAPADPERSENTNLSLFRYHDDFGYTKPQRCMVHQDNGLVTILAPPTLPGLEILDPVRREWVKLEEHLGPNDMVVYTGLSIDHMTRGAIPAAVHRVVRYPGKERYSMPFEAKPSQDALLPILRHLEPVTTAREVTMMKPPGDHSGCETETVSAAKEDATDITFERLEKRMGWYRVMRQVARADAVEHPDFKIAMAQLHGNSGNAHSDD